MTLILFGAHRHEDDRGWFAEAYSARRLASAGIDVDFVQDNESFSSRAGTIRGLHFQRPPFAQAKLVACLRGTIIDVVVDVRAGSPTFGRSLSVRLTDAGERLFVPVGYAHGFVTLTPSTHVSYKVSADYHPESEGGVNWHDPSLALDVEMPDTPTMSQRDRDLPLLEVLDSPFAYDGTGMILTRV